MKNKLDKKKYIEYLGTNLIRIVQGLYDNTMNFIEGNKKRPNQRKKKKPGRKASVVSMA